MNRRSAPVVAQGHAGVAPTTDRQHVRVVSWNIQFGLEVDAAARELGSRDSLAEADLVLLQEMDEVGTAEVARSLAMNFVFAAPGVHQQTARSFGNAILSPWPIDDPSVVSLPFTASVSGQARVLVHSVVTVGGIPIDVGSVHTEVPTLGAAKRRAQFDRIAAAFEATPRGPAIVGGDFNTVTRRGIESVRSRMAAVGARRVTADAGPTLRRQGREFTLDHVFARGFEPVASGVVAGSPASDHRPIWVQLAEADSRP